MAAYFMYGIPFQHQLGVFFASFRCGCCVVLQNVPSREVTHVLRSIYACQLGARSVDLVFADELHVHLPDAMRRPFRGILPHALFALGPLLAEEVFQKAYHPVRPHDEHAELLTPPHGILCHAADAVVATFKVGRGREVVVDEEADVVHAVCQEADISPSLALLPASIRKHVHPRRPALLSSGGSGIAPVPAQVVVRNFGEAVQMEVAVVSHVLQGKDPRLCHVDPAFSSLLGISLCIICLFSVYFSLSLCLSPLAHLVDSFQHQIGSFCHSPTAKPI